MGVCITQNRMGYHLNHYLGVPAKNGAFPLSLFLEAGIKMTSCIVQREQGVNSVTDDFISTK